MKNYEKLGNWSSNNELAHFQSALLGPTLANALKTSYYQHVWQGLDITSIHLEGLSALPIITKASLKQAGKKAQVTQNLICDEMFTGGTSGDPFVYVVSRDEQEYVKKFFSSLYSLGPEKHLSRALNYKDPTVACARYIPSPIRFHDLSIYCKGSFSYGRNLLKKAYEEPHVDTYCSMIAATERILRAFTMDTLNQYPNGFESDVNYLVSYGQYITKNWRQTYKKAWNCELIDRYGLSEVMGGATLDPESGWYLFDSIVIPEVVGIRSLEPIFEGIGVLVLTPLFPFQSSQPLVRYWTDDLVEVTHSKGPIAGRISIRPLGRAKYGVPAPCGDDWILTPADIYEAMDDSSKIDRTSLFADAKQINIPNDLGHPIYTTQYDYDNKCTNIKIKVKLKSEILEKEHFSILSQIKDRVVKSSIFLPKFLEERVATFDVQRSSSIEPDIISYPA